MGVFFLLNAVANFLIKLIIWISGLLISVVTLPIYLILRPFLPELPTQLEIFSTYLSQHVFRGLAFAREVFFNTTGYPRTLFYALITFYLFKLGVRLSLLVFQFIIKLYYIIRGSSPGSSSS